MKENISKTLEERIKDRTTQGKEMEAIWETADKETRAYLRGCIMTAHALADKKAGQEAA